MNYSLLLDKLDRLGSLSVGPHELYFLAVVLGGLLVVSWLWRRIRAVELGRRRAIGRIKKFESVTTETPLDNPVAEARERSLENVKTRFAVIRRLLIPAAALVIALALSIPLARNMSAAFISFLFGVITVVLGIAAKPFIENIIAGLVISFSQPIRIGDTVLMEDKMYGTVEDISLTFTVVKLWDWRRFIVPNHRMLQKEFVNLSLVDRYTWGYVEFWVTHDADLAEVETIAVNAAKEAEHFASHETPAFWVMELGERGIKCWVAAWADTPSLAWELKHEIRVALARELRRRGIQCHTYHHHLAGNWKEPANLSEM